MPALFENAFFPVFAIVAFVAVVLFVEALYLLWSTYNGPEATKVKQRLQALSAGATDFSERASVLKNRMLSELPAVNRLLFAVPRVHRLDRFILQSGLDWTVGKLLCLSLLFGLTVFTLLFVARFPALLQGIVPFPAMFLPWAYVQWKRHRRLYKIQTQLPDALDLIGRALRAGHALPSGLKMAGEEMSDPIAGEFRITHDEMNFGVSMQQALGNLGERVPITDMRYLVVAVLIQREAGGNLTEVLDNLGTLIRDRLKFHSRVRVLTTEGRMSAWVLGLMPFALGVLMAFANPDFINVLWTDPAGIKLTNAILVIEALGALWLYRLIQVRV